LVGGLADNEEGDAVTTTKIKRSMSVYPHPIVEKSDGSSRFPTFEENPFVYDQETGLSKQQWQGQWGYKIKRVTNSVDYRPGLPLSKTQVKKLIEDDWTISVLT
jgi:hypothetical protein